MSKPHKHAALIKAWADGAIIEVKTAEGNWAVTGYPSWRPTKEFRIKPEPNDLEKYGVCVGDLWLLEESSVFFNYLVTRTRGGGLAEGIVVGTGSKKKLDIEGFDAMLVLRRGEVNKL